MDVKRSRQCKFLNSASNKRHSAYVRKMTYANMTYARCFEVNHARRETLRLSGSIQRGRNTRNTEPLCPGESLLRVAMRPLYRLTTSAQIQSPSPVPVRSLVV